MYGGVTNFISFLKPESGGCTNLAKLCVSGKNKKERKKRSFERGPGLGALLWVSLRKRLYALIDSSIDQSA